MNRDEATLCCGWRRFAGALVLNGSDLLLVQTIYYRWRFFGKDSY